MMPQFVQTIRGPKADTGTSSPKRSRSIQLHGGRDRRRPHRTDALRPHVGERHRRAAVAIRRHRLEVTLRRAIGHIVPPGDRSRRPASGIGSGQWITRYWLARSVRYSQTIDRNSQGAMAMAIFRGSKCGYQRLAVSIIGLLVLPQAATFAQINMLPPGYIDSAPSDRPARSWAADAAARARRAKAGRARALGLGR